jgi:hypothetical protein
LLLYAKLGQARGKKLTFINDYQGSASGDMDRTQVTPVYGRRQGPAIPRRQEVPYPTTTIKVSCVTGMFND